MSNNNYEGAVRFVNNLQEDVRRGRYPGFRLNNPINIDPACSRTREPLALEVTFENPGFKTTTFTSVWYPDTHGIENKALCAVLRTGCVPMLPGRSRYNLGRDQLEEVQVRGGMISFALVVASAYRVGESEMSH